jgi:hypothetical protein
MLKTSKITKRDLVDVGDAFGERGETTARTVQVSLPADPAEMRERHGGSGVAMRRRRHRRVLATDGMVMIHEITHMQ